MARVNYIPANFVMIAGHGTKAGVWGRRATAILVTVKFANGSLRFAGGSPVGCCMTRCESLGNADAMAEMRSAELQKFRNQDPERPEHPG